MMAIEKLQLGDNQEPDSDSGKYVVHFCKNSNNQPARSKKKLAKQECNNAWIDKDLFNSETPPNWKLCIHCAGGLEAFEAQKPRQKDPVKVERGKKWRQAQLDKAAASG